MLQSDATRKQEQIEHLAQVHALCKAIASAISAIEKNDLRQFESHLALQETICNRLACTKGTLTLNAPGKFGPGESIDAQLRKEIWQAYKALAQLNRVYGALLKRVRRTVELMATLYRSQGQGYGRGPSSLLKHHSWSCEV